MGHVALTPGVSASTTDNLPGPSLFFMTVDSSDPSISIPLGITIGLLASFIQSLGLTIQRKSHVLNQALPEQQQKVEHRRPYVPYHSALISVIQYPIDCGCLDSVRNMSFHVP